MPAHNTAIPVLLAVHDLVFRTPCLTDNRAPAYQHPVQHSAVHPCEEDTETLQRAYDVAHGAAALKTLSTMSRQSCILFPLCPGRRVSSLLLCWTAISIDSIPMLFILWDESALTSIVTWVLSNTC